MRTNYFVFARSPRDAIISSNHIMTEVEFTIEPVIGGNMLVVTDRNRNRIIGNPFNKPLANIWYIDINNQPYAANRIKLVLCGGVSAVYSVHVPINFCLGDYSSLCISNRTGVELRASGDNESVIIPTGTSRRVDKVVTSYGAIDVADGGCSFCCPYPSLVARTSSLSIKPISLR